MTHIFRHPKYYKEMRAERKKHQASSNKRQAYQINYDDFCRGDEEASSNKPQATSSLENESHSQKPEPSSSEDA